MASEPIQELEIEARAKSLRTLVRERAERDVESGKVPREDVVSSIFFTLLNMVAEMQLRLERIEGGTKSCNLHADCNAADEAVRECSGRSGALHCSDHECMRGDCAKVNGRRAANRCTP